jgi:hypothetical protein
MASPGAARSADRTHWTHVAVVLGHALCCGAPLALTLTGLLAGGVASLVFDLHHVLHKRELWIAALSAILVSIGGWEEVRRLRAGGRVSPWFLLSLAAFAANLAILSVHRFG